MGQKIIPKSFRLNYVKNWEFSEITTKENYSNLFFLNYNIYIYLKQICITQQLMLTKTKFIKKGGTNKVLVLLYKNPYYNKGFKQKVRTGGVNIQNNKTIIQTQFQNFCDVLKICLNLELCLFTPKLIHHKKISQYFRIINSCKKRKIYRKVHRGLLDMAYLSLLTQSIRLFNSFLISNLVKTNRHIPYLRQFNKIFKHLFNKAPCFLGYRIQWKGRLNGKERAKLITFQAGVVPLNTIKHRIKYDFQEVITSAGACSLKTWLVFSIKKKNVIS